MSRHKQCAKGLRLDFWLEKPNVPPQAMRIAFCAWEKERKGRRMNLIASADKNWAIGLNNKLLVRIPEDMKFFQKTTTGKVVVMGRKTLESLPGGLPLKNRTNIVLTSNRAFQAKGAKAVHSVEELLEELKQYRSEDIYIIGGERVYRELLGLCDVAHITKLDYGYEADAWIPNLDEAEDWELTGSSEEQTYFDLEYHFLKYERKKKAGKEKHLNAK